MILLLKITIDNNLKISILLGYAKYKNKNQKSIDDKTKKAVKKPVALRQATKKAAPVAAKPTKAKAKPSAPSAKIPFKKR